jgi:hypothetical protein
MMTERPWHKNPFYSRSRRNRNQQLCVLAIFAVQLSLFSVLALAQQAPTSADTFVNSAAPNTNYGSNIYLAVGSGATSYLKFNLSAIPAGPSVAKATLRLFIDAVPNSVQLDVYNLPPNPTWTEGG